MDHKLFDNGESNLIAGHKGIMFLEDKSEWIMEHIDEKGSQFIDKWTKKLENWIIGLKKLHMCRKHSFMDNYCYLKEELICSY